MINPKFINTSSSSSPSPFLGGDHHDHLNHHHHHYHEFFVPNTYQSSSSSTSLSCHMFFKTPQDHHQSRQHDQYYGVIKHQLPEKHHANYQEGENRVESCDLDKKEGKSLKLTLWKNEKQADNNNNNEEEEEITNNSGINSKWMCSKIRLMQKMKNSVGNKLTSTTTREVMNHNHVRNKEEEEEDNHKKQVQGSSSFESDHFSTSNVSSTYNGNPTVRVCADCNTTKTPLWRSGPKGPKSLCNACGIRQRKARRAMAAAAAVTTTTTTNGVAETTATLKIKVQNKEKLIKKRCSSSSSNSNKITTESSSSSHHHNDHDHNDHDDDYDDDDDDAQRKKKMKKNKKNNNKKKKKKKNVLEDFLLSLNENLSIQRVFPQDEKEAAILLMALSCGLVHG